MTQNEHYKLIEKAAEKSFHLLQELQQTPIQLADIFHQYEELTHVFYELSNALMQHPDTLLESQLSFWTESMQLMHDQWQAFFIEGKPLQSEDKRFANVHWFNNPYFNMLSQQYLLITKHIKTLIDNLEFKDKTTAKQMRFFVSQYLDALAPSNFMLTNPTLIAETLQSQGKNILKGLNNLLNDMRPGSNQLQVTMTNKSAFKVGQNLAITPGKVIFRNEMMELIQYAPSTSMVYVTPLLMIPAWINKYYILDLSPHNSLIKWLVAQGMTVFVISWVNPDATFAKKTLYDYMQAGPATAVDIIKKQMQVTRINSLGFCLGGTLQAMYLAYNQYHGDKSVRSATYLATLLDFSDPGDISVFIDDEQVEKLEKTMQEKGYLPGDFMNSSFNALRANDLFWSFFIKNYLQGKDAAPFDILYWNGDSTNMPATMHSEYLRWMYLHNQLIARNTIHLNHTPIDIQSITIPSFFLGTQKDHIAPWKSVWSGFSCMKGKKQFVLGGSGHIAGIINPADSEKYDYFTNPDIGKTADDWLAQAKQHTGSWWPFWLQWLIKQSGKKIKAPDFADLPYSGLMEAPGDYVLNKLASISDK